MKLRFQTIPHLFSRFNPCELLGSSVLQLLYISREHVFFVIGPARMQALTYALKLSQSLLGLVGVSARLGRRDLNCFFLFAHTRLKLLQAIELRALLGLGRF